MERMPSIFNDVLSPVTPGPSSSNTCGPYRIARLARALLGEPPRRITVRMARRGGYYDTFYSMHSHEAILAALLGQELLRCDLSTMCRQADEAGLCYDFQFVDDLPVRPSELAEMELSGDRRTIRLTGCRWAAARSRSPVSTAATSCCRASAGRRYASVRRALV